jgi:hypothetical protein
MKSKGSLLYPKIFNLGLPLLSLILMSAEAGIVSILKVIANHPTTAEVQILNTTVSIQIVGDRLTIVNPDHPHLDLHLISAEAAGALSASMSKVMACRQIIVNLLLLLPLTLMSAAMIQTMTVIKTLRIFLNSKEVNTTNE